MVEALVAVLVLSLGLLGVAAMQLKALQSAHMGYQRAVVSLAAIDAQERAWAGLSQASTHACPDTSAFENAWVSHWFNDMLIDAGSSLSGSDCTYTATIDWQEERYATGESGMAFVYQFQLPEL